VSWSKLSGPGTVSFANPSAASTSAAFSASGSYVLRLTANDGALTSSDDVAVTVLPAANTAPVVNAGADQVVVLPFSASLFGTVTDDGKPNPPGAVTTTWSRVSGPSLVSFGNASSKNTTATFLFSGTYVLRLTASDGALSASDDITITVKGLGTGPCAGVCLSPTNLVINGTFQSGSLGTGSRCYQTTSVMKGGSCTNFVSPRTLKLNGTTMTCNNSNWTSLPATKNSGYCIQISSGNSSSASFTAF
jgi:hypothetical protein